MGQGNEPVTRNELADEMAKALQNALPTILASLEEMKKKEKRIDST